MIDYRKLLYYAGTRLRVIFACTAAGDRLGQDFMDALDVNTWGKIDRVLKRLADQGRISNTELFRKVGSDLWEVKEGGGKRLVGYFMAGHFVITHGFEKRGGGKAANKFPSEERERAERIRREFEMVFNRINRERSK